MSDLDKFYQKNGTTVRNMARDVLLLREGDVLTPIAAYTEKFQISRWTVQTAIQILLEEKCFSMEKHGPKGTQIFQMDREKLWRMANLKPFLGFVPPASTNIHHSLYTGLIEAIHKTDIPFNLGFMIPASTRAEMLALGKCHMIITSKYAADYICREHENLQVALEIPGAQYTVPFRLYGRPNTTEIRIEDGTRVGIYRDAIEQKDITEYLCQGKKVVPKYGNYHEGGNMLARGEIDVLVQRGDVVMAPMAHCPYKELTELPFNQDMITPVIICNRNDYGVEEIIKKFIDVKCISDVQWEVLNDKRDMAYY